MEGTPGGDRLQRPAPVLSLREIDILVGAARGLPTECIAAKYGLSVHTVRTHFKNILGKLGAHTRAHAVAIAYTEGLIHPDVHGTKAPTVAQGQRRQRRFRRQQASEGKASST